MMGLDQPTPTAKFGEHSSKLFDEYPAFEQLGLPRSVLNRIADPRVTELLSLARGLLADNAEHVAACCRIDRGS